jgi:hypothetical protein
VMDYEELEARYQILEAERELIKKALARFGIPVEELEELIGDPMISEPEEYLVKGLVKFMRES